MAADTIVYVFDNSCDNLISLPIKKYLFRLLHKKGYYNLSKYLNVSLSFYCNLIVIEYSN